MPFLISEYRCRRLLKELRHNRRSGLGQKVLLRDHLTMQPERQPSTVDLVASILTRQQRAKPGSRPAPSISSSRQRGEKRLRFRNLGKFRGLRKTLEHRREQGTASAERLVEL
jgi:hypothetical protein